MTEAKRIGMGRHSGHLALWSGVAGQADIILIPEHPFRYEKVYRLLKGHLGDSTSHPRDPRHPRYSVVVVAEGAYAEDGELIIIDDRHDAFGHARLGGIAEVLARRIMSDTPYGGFFADNYFDLIPGQKVEVKFRTGAAIALNDFRSNLKIRTMADAF